MYTPPFTVVVPTYGRPVRLARCLAALATQDYPRDRYAVAVVDDGSPKSLGETVRSFESTMDVTLVRQPNAGPAAARNAGVARADSMADSMYVAFTDDDCEPRPGWLRAFAAAFERAPTAFLGGHTVNALPHNPYAHTTQLLVDYLYAYAKREPAGRFFASNNIALPLEGFRALGGFHAGFPLAAGEDRDLCARWIQSGGHLRSVPGAVVDHAHDLTFKTFWQQHTNYGRGAYRLHRLRAGQGGPEAPPAADFFLGLLRYPFEKESAPRAALYTGLILLSQAATASGYAYEAYAHGAEAASFDPAPVRLPEQAAECGQPEF